MGKEYLFSYTPQPDGHFDEKFELSKDNNNGKYLISNIKGVDSEIYAPEINVYFQNSTDDIRRKIQNIKKLYDARATAFDCSQHIESSVHVGDNVLIISKEDQKDVVEELRKSGFTSIATHPLNIIEVKGYIGKLQVSLKVEDTIRMIETHQILWFDAPNNVSGITGIYDPVSSSIEKTIKNVRSNHGTYHFKKFIKYNHAICQHHHKRNDICGKCADICPTGALSNTPHSRQIEITAIQCNGCGRCAAICPSGALDFAPFPRASFQNILSFYKESIALIIPSRIDVNALLIPLPDSVLPLIVDSEEFLDESYLLSLLQTTGKPIAVYTDTVSSMLGNSIRIINDIFNKKYDSQAILICHNETELGEAFSKISSSNNSVYLIDEKHLSKREIFALRLSHLIEDDDFGTIYTGPHIHYGNVVVNEDTCTLCLSCADACPMGALTVHPEDNTLRCNPSLCTSCGYCEMTCPENDCLQVIHDQLALNPDSFKENVLARDEIFKCVMCGVGFAPAKSIARISAIMKPLFREDQAKITSLSCCPDCKAKLMLETLNTHNIDI